MLVRAGLAAGDPPGTHGDGAPSVARASSAGGATSPGPRRVRKGRELSFADVSRHFDLPLAQAAERLNVCATLVKRICRENGVSRWPHRKLQSRKKKERIAAEQPRVADGSLVRGSEIAHVARGLGHATLQYCDVMGSHHTLTSPC